MSEPDLSHVHGGGPARTTPPGTYTIGQTANIVGISEDTLRRWRKTKYFIPSESQQNGQLTVYLYTDQDIEDLKGILGIEEDDTPTVDLKKKED